MEESAIEQNSARVLPKTPSTEDSDFLSFHAIRTYFIPLCSNRRAQQPPGNGIGIHPVVVEESAIEQNSARVPKTPTIQVGNILSFHAIGTYLIPTCS